MQNEIYFNQLRNHLRGLNDDEIDDVLSFYREYAEDGGLTGERLVQEFGTPKQLARRVLIDYSIRYDDVVDGDVPPTGESGRRQANNRIRRQMNLLWIVLLGLLTSWMWIPAVFMILLGLFMVLLLLVVVVIVLIATGVAGIFGIIGGIAVVFQSWATGLWWFGIGLILIGIQFVAWPVGLYILKVALDGLITFVKFVGRRFSKQKGDTKNA